MFEKIDVLRVFKEIFHMKGQIQTIVSKRTYRKT